MKSVEIIAHIARALVAVLDAIRAIPEDQRRLYVADVPWWRRARLAWVRAWRETAR